MEREKHYMQDAAEIYAVYLMQSEVERLGKAIRCTSPDLWTTFTNYLEERGLSTNDFELTELGSYKANADRHIPNFVARLCEMNADQLFEFQLVESEFRNLGLKGDFIIIGSTWDEPVAVSLKNYAGKSGILRPQVASGTFASFAAGFVFEKAGVGKYIDPRDPAKTFQGSNVKTRNEILSWMGADEIASRLAVLDQLQSMVREEFLGEDCRYYDKLRVQVAARKIASIGIDAVIAVFDLLGLDKVRSRFVERIGMDGKEEVLFFDSERCVDSITNRRYHDFRLMLNSAETHLLQSPSASQFDFSLPVNSQSSKSAFHSRSTPTELGGVRQNATKALKQSSTRITQWNSNGESDGPTSPKRLLHQ